jgi:hypothetical protein
MTRIVLAYSEIYLDFEGVVTLARQEWIPAHLKRSDC